ncbi:Amino acid adenylation domain-containing protein [Sulfidibacter corallicola]|uniref:Amino acid adenylation domain-containing protein n=2 Tax=Sulfidibacter corallicola TaxID=2818388 RepID=A0A8A4TUN1_SULCO|nr:non-ribosomal peptide synthetase [Sulfidibacter corallicola]QTD50235.1 amino acid adenylation domain-containing protein [Sulfidibacter corallicola]
MNTQEKIELFLRHAVAAHLKKAVDEVPIHLGYFELGLKSAAVVGLVRDIERKIEGRLLPSVLFKYPTIEQLRDYLHAEHEADFARMVVRRTKGRKAKRSRAAESGSRRLKPLPGGARFFAEPQRSQVGSGAEAAVREAERPPASETAEPMTFPLTEGQQGLWALQKMMPTNSAYNVPLAIALRETVDVAALKKAVHFLIAQHPILAATVAEHEGQLVQRWRPGREPSFVERDCSGMDMAAVHELMRATTREAFDLERGPLLRVALFSRGPEEHFLLAVVHHILFDGVSFLPFLKTLLHAYRDLCAGRQPQARTLPADFRDYAAAEHAMITGVEGRRRLDYWRTQLEGPLPSLQLPTDTPRAAMRLFEGATHIQALPEPLTSDLRALAETHRCFLSTLFLAAFKVLLSRYSGQRDLVVGMVTNQRGEPRFQEAIGYFIDMLPLRSRWTEAASFADLLEGLQATLLDSLANGYPFPALVRELQVPYSADEPPVFNVAYTFQDAVATGDLAGLSGSPQTPVELIQGLHQEGGYELGLEVFDEGPRFTLHVKYNPSLYGAETAARMAGHLTHLLTEVVTDASRSVDALPLLDARERRTILVDWNRTETAYPADKTAYELFWAQAARTPDKVAVACEERSLSYAELAERCDVLGAYLRSEGVAPGSLVGLCVDRSLDMMVGLLGVMASGGAYVPLDPGFPAERLAYMVADSEAGIVLTQSRYLEMVADLVGPETMVVALDRDWDRIAEIGAAQIEVPSPGEWGTDRTAYVMYTSGSTGKPKGVVVPHRGLTNFLWSMAREPGLGADDRLLAVTTYCFDISGLELYLPLLVGGTCVICAADKVGDAVRLRDEIARVQPTLMQATPATWTMLFLAGWRNREGVRVLCGGEALPEPLAQRFAETGCDVWNMFGPTETTIWSTVRHIEPGAPVTIGKPIANTHIYILDGRGEPAPVGVPGELSIGGDGVASGYLNRPELTEARFVEDPFVSGGKVYRTGDLARWLADGSIEFLGRMDGQVKVRGYRIELGEIESRLDARPEVAEAAAVVRRDGDNHRLVAYVVPAAGARIDAPALRAALKRSLPDYMVPELILELDALPLTPNAKLDRKTLAARPIAVQRVPAAQVPQSELESQVRDIWRTALEVAEIGVDDGFFEVGGNSISAVIVAARIQKALDAPFDVTALFRHPTIRETARHIAKMRGEEPAAEGLRAQRTPRVVPLNGRRPAPSDQALETPDRDAVDLPDYYDHSLAVIGLSCRFPGADDLDAFWDLLREGREGGTTHTRDDLRQRGVPERVLRERDLVSRSLGIAGKDLFDPGFFGIPPRDAAFMDPQFRHLLMHAWWAVEDAGYAPGAIPDTSVFVSAGSSLYQALCHEIRSGGYVLERTDDYVAWLLGQGGTIPTLISYKLGFRGPSVFVHTNCSSTLTGLHLAWRSLQAGEARHALVGGAALFPGTNLGYVHQAGLNFSSDGRIKAFDAAADGMISGEGVGVMLVKRAVDAVRDGDRIYALVRGVAVNNDGAEKAGFYAPSARGQAAVIDRVLTETGVDPATIGYVEAHGTGTKLGDPIEVAALREAWRPHTDAKGFCGLGSVKTNLGHLDTTAGLAGCIKTVLALHHGQLPPTLNYRRANPAIDFTDSPFYVVDRLQPWPEGSEPRRAAVSSFGIGGTNAHAILEAYRPSRHAAERAALAPVRCSRYLVPLSARDEARLRDYAASLLTWLNERAAGDGAFELADLAFTLGAGRAAMAQRLVFAVTDEVRLRRELARFLAGKGDGTAWFRGAADKAGDDLLSEDDQRRLVAEWIERRQFERIAKAWCAGYPVDWSALWGSFSSEDRRPPRRIAAPSYPFARESYWPEPKPVSDGSGGAGVLHPLVHRNAANLNQLRFTTTLTGGEFFLADHVIEHRKILPGVAYLEMIRAAVALAARRPDGAEPAIRLRTCVWLRPIAVTDTPVEVAIELAPQTENRISCTVTTEADGPGGARIEHFRGDVLLVPTEVEAELGLTALRERMTEERVPGEVLYRGQDRATFLHGPSLRGVRAAVRGGRAPEGEALGELALPECVADTLDRFAAHPSLLDSGVQVALHFATGRLTAQATANAVPGYGVPFALDEMEVLRPCSEAMWVWARHAASGDAGGRSNGQSLDLDFCDDQGRICLRLKGLAYRLLTPGQANWGAGEIDTLLLEPTWTERPVSAVHGSRATGEKADRRRIVLCGFPRTCVAALHGTLAPLHKVEALPVDAAAPPALRFRDQALRLFHIVREEIEAGLDGGALLQVVVPSDGPDHLSTALAGLLKTARLEHPRLRTQLVELDPHIEHAELASVLGAALGDLDAVHLRHEGDSLKVPHWRELEPDSASSPWRDRGLYLITGGSGGLGLMFAEDIAAKARDVILVLTGRSALGREVRDRIARIRAAGADVRYRQLDVADKAAVEKLIAELIAEAAGQDRPALHGVLHLAGVVDDRYLVKKTGEAFRAVLEPKVLGAANLDAATRDIPLDFFISFSSMSAQGGPGQADYAAANAFLDAYAIDRAARVSSDRADRGPTDRGPTDRGPTDRGPTDRGPHGRSLAIAWPLWQAGGMAADEAARSRLAETLGLQPLATDQGLAAFYRAWASGRPNVAVVSGDVRKLRRAFLTTADSRDVEPRTETAVPSPATPVDPDDLFRRLRAELGRAVSDLLKVDAGRIRGEASFDDYGFDSISFADFANRLNKTFGLALLPTIFFEYPNLDALTTHLLEQHRDALANRLQEGRVRQPLPRTPAEPAPAKTEARVSGSPWRVEPQVAPRSEPAVGDRGPEPIAIVGISGTFPNSPDVAALWRNLETGTDCISEIPADRWDWRRIFGDPLAEPNRTNVKWGGFVDTVPEFDPLFFGISPREAEFMDPQQRLLMTYVWSAIEDAGYSARALAGKRLGLFIGTDGTSGYASLMVQARRGIESYSATSVPSFGPNRMSYFLDVTGPSEPVETACSSSLVAIDRAIQAMRAGSCEMAVVGGVHALVNPSAHISFSKAGALAPDGRCKTFSPQANGFALSEGAGMLVLKKLRDAEAAGDHIYGVVRATAVNHGGRASSMTAPNPKAQAALLRSAWRQAGVDPRTVGYIETHGTGTKLGDPAEINGLKLAFRELYRDTGDERVTETHCALGSVKSNLGHLVLAAGVAGVIKVLLQLKHKTLAKSLHTEDINPFIQLEGSPFTIVRETQAWPAPRDAAGRELPRRAGVSSFGIGGANAHVVIEEYRAPDSEQPAPTSSGPVAILLSARNGKRLRDYAQKLLTYCEARPENAGDPGPDADLAAVAFTLQTGRDAMDVRLGTVVGSFSELAERLRGFLADGSSAPGLAMGRVRHDDASSESAADVAQRRAEIERLLEEGAPTELLAHWVDGAEVDWARLYAHPPRRLSLPTYPFARDRYWLPEGIDWTRMQGVAGSTAALHPLVQRNASTFAAQRYGSVFDRDAFFLRDHQVDGRPMLPGVAYLEMARAAYQDALGEDAAPALAVKNVVWLRPFVLDKDSRELHIALKPSGSGAEFEVATEAVVHCQGTVQAEAVAAEPEPLDLDALRDACDPEAVASDRLYAAFSSPQFRLGPSFRAIHRLYRGESGVLAELVLPPSVGADREAFVLHPSLLDSALQASTALFGDASTEGFSRPALPFTLVELTLYRPLPDRLWAWVRATSRPDGAAKTRKLDLDLCDGEGRLCVRMRGFSFRIFGEEVRTEPANDETLLLAPQWLARPIPAVIEPASLQRHYVCVLDKPHLAQALRAEKGPYEAMSLPVDDPDDMVQGFHSQALGVLELLQRLESVRASEPMLVQLVVPCNGADPGSAQGLHGLLATGTTELLALWTQLLFVPADLGAAELHSLLLAERRGLEHAVRHGGGRRQGARRSAIRHRSVHFRRGERLELVPKPLPNTDPAEPTLPWRQDGVYLITGGLGGLGVLFAREIADRVAGARLILVGRSPLSAEGETVLRELNERGAHSEYQQVDVARAEQVTVLVDEIHADYGRLNGILHCAGVLRDSLLARKTRAELNAVLAPKVAGAVNLDRASRGMGLDLFLLCSSLAAEIGSLGQAGYAAANGFLDAFAAYRNKLVAVGRRDALNDETAYGHTLAVDWPYWRDGGMRIDDRRLDALRAQAGMAPLPAEAGFAALYRVLTHEIDRVLVLHGDGPRLRELFSPDESEQTEPTALDQVVTREVEPETSPLPVDEKRLFQKVRAVLAEALSGLLKIPLDEIDPGLEFDRYGLESIMLTDFSNQLNGEHRLGLIPTVFYEHPTLDKLTRHLIASDRDALARRFLDVGAPTEPEKRGQARPEPSLDTGAKGPAPAHRFQVAKPVAATEAAAVPVDPGAAEEGIAIVGMSGRFPMAADLDALWANLAAGRDCIRVVPAERWDWREVFGDPLQEANKTDIRWGGFIDRAGDFDPRFFGITPKEALAMDPHQRLLLTYAWLALEDAGHAAASLAGQDLGVFVGTANSDYGTLFGRANETIEGFSTTALSPSAGPNRISFFLDVHGPSEPIETACSSSLVAIHRAVQSIHAGCCSMALVGGVHVVATPGGHIGFSKAQALSKDGRCKTFAPDADGFAIGEGVGMLLLKRLSRAEADGDHIYGVIRATAENHGGRANSLTSPNPVAQAELLKKAYRKADIDPRTVGYVETHGTGTKLGDPAEINGLKSAFGELYRETGEAAVTEPHCGLGSIKSNIGHAVLAAGVAGVIKVLLQMKHRTLVKSLHCARVNPYIDLGNSPFYLVRENRPWASIRDDDGNPLPRRAGISSFGFGGANAHVILEEYIPPDVAEREARTDEPVAFVLSAKSEAVLRTYATSLLTHVKANYLPPDRSDAPESTRRQKGDEKPGRFIRRMNETKPAGKESPQAQEGSPPHTASPKGAEKPGRFIRRMNETKPAGEESPQAKEGSPPHTASPKGAEKPGRFIRRMNETKPAGKESPQAKEGSPAHTASPKGDEKPGRFIRRMNESKPAGKESPQAQKLASHHLESTKETLRNLLAQILAVEPADIDVDQAFESFGLSRIQKLELHRRLLQRFEVELDAHAFLQMSHPSELLALLDFAAEPVFHEPEPDADRADPTTVRPEPVIPSLSDVAFTLQVGREAMTERLGFLVTSFEALAERLEAFLSQPSGGDGHDAMREQGLFRGRVTRNRANAAAYDPHGDKAEDLDRLTDQRRLDELLALWVDGHTPDWRRLYAGRRPKRLALPTYPFAFENFWVGQPRAQAGADSATSASPPHPAAGADEAKRTQTAPERPSVLQQLKHLPTLEVPRTILGK